MGYSLGLLLTIFFHEFPILGFPNFKNVSTNQNQNKPCLFLVCLNEQDFFYCLKYRENWKHGIRNWRKHVVNSSKVINSSFYRVYMCSMNPTLSLGSPSSSYTNLFDRIHANKNQFLLDNEV